MTKNRSDILDAGAVREARARVFESLPSRTTPHGTWYVCPTCSGDGKFVEFDQGCAARWAHPLLNGPSTTPPARVGEASLREARSTLEGVALQNPAPTVKQVRDAIAAFEDALRRVGEPSEAMVADLANAVEA